MSGGLWVQANCKKSSTLFTCMYYCDDTKLVSLSIQNKHPNYVFIRTRREKANRNIVNITQSRLIIFFLHLQWRALKHCCYYYGWDEHEQSYRCWKWGRGGWHPYQQLHFTDPKSKITKCQIWFSFAFYPCISAPLVESALLFFTLYLTEVWANRWKNPQHWP